MIVIHHTKSRGLVQRIAIWLQVAYLRMRIDAALSDLRELRGPKTQAAFWTGELRAIRQQMDVHTSQIQRWERRINALELSQ